jgi:hypothetical protein
MLIKSLQTKLRFDIQNKGEIVKIAKRFICY